MKKILGLLILAVLLAMALTGCKYTGNRSWIDTVYSFDRAIVYSPNGEKIAEGRVENWHDYDDGDQLQVKINGKTYLTAAENIILIKE